MTSKTATKYQVTRASIAGVHVGKIRKQFRIASSKFHQAIANPVGTLAALDTDFSEAYAKFQKAKWKLESSFDAACNRIKQPVEGK